MQFKEDVQSGKYSEIYIHMYIGHNNNKSPDKCWRF